MKLWMGGLEWFLVVSVAGYGVWHYGLIAGRNKGLQFA